VLSSVIVFFWKDITTLLEPFFLWFEENLALGIVFYSLLYITFVPLLMPGTILTLAGAFTFS
jgi:uncharacterized membrane protein YdjX (TVP38/TMEM64 family)